MPEASDHVELILPPPLIYLGHLLSALVLQWAVPLTLPSRWNLPLRVTGALLVAGGLLLAAAAVREMRRLHTTPDHHRATAALVTSGPYRLTRNPIYLGFLFIFLGFTLLAGTFWGLLLAPFLIGTVTRSIIHAEEAYLQDKFKEQYNAYRSLVRRWL
jgi:protein-S-isoprenylcysteine O-methyltransferase Ste14